MFLYYLFIYYLLSFLVYGLYINVDPVSVPKPQSVRHWVYIEAVFCLILVPCINYPSAGKTRASLSKHLWPGNRI
ncbi:hypothetical protein CLU79DRAFT_749204 [Phycomyces nitens]|nr:hypothetical protein CLU79DRAFT_749204 [Phycomyces nitens]